MTTPTIEQGTKMRTRRRTNVAECLSGYSRSIISTRRRSSSSAGIPYVVVAVNDQWQ